MLNKKEFEVKTKNKNLYKIYFPTNSYAQMKSGEDIHFMSCDNATNDDFIEVDKEGLDDLILQIYGKDI